MVLALLVNRMNAYVQVEVSVEGIVPLTMTHLAYTAHRGQEDGRGGGVGIEPAWSTQTGFRHDPFCSGWQLCNSKLIHASTVQLPMLQSVKPGLAMLRNKSFKPVDSDQSQQIRISYHFRFLNGLILCGSVSVSA